MLRAVFSVGIDLFLVAVFLAACALPGIALLSRLDGLCRTERRLLGAMVGVGGLGTLLGLLAIIGRFDRFHIAWLLALCGLAGLVGLRRLGGVVPGQAVEDDAPGWWWPVAAALPVALLLSLYPPSAFDDTLYHLPLAQDLAEQGRLVVRPELRYPVFPLFHEVWVAALFVLGGGDTGAHLFSTAVMALFGGVVVLWTRRRSGGDAACIAAALVLGCPLVVWLGSAAYVDLTMALFAVAALWMLDGGATRDRPSRWVLAAGFAGIAAATKYHGLFFVGVVGVAALAAAWRGRRPGYVLAAGLAVFATAGPWYLRNIALTGNPVFPFLTGLFGLNHWTMPDSALAGPQGWSLAEPSWGGLGTLLLQLGKLGLELLRSPWLLLRDAIDPESVPPLSPFAAVVLPLAGFWGLFRRETRSPGTCALSGLALGYLALWLLGVRDVRYLLPAVALLAVVAAGRLAASLDRRVVLALAVLFLAPAWGFGGLRLVKRGLPPLSPVGRSAYLDRWLPGQALLSRSAETLGPNPTVYGLGTEQLQYYAPGRLLGDWNGPYRFNRLEPLLEEPEKVAAELRELGAQALLIAEGRIAAPSDFLTLLDRRGGFELWGLTPPP